MDAYILSACVSLCVHIWGCESIWACTLTSICALFVCHSPLKLQLPSRHDFPLCRNQQTSQHLTNTSPQPSLRLKKTSITRRMTRVYCFLWQNISHGDLTHTHTLNVQVSRMEGVTELPHPLSWPALMKPHTFGHPPPFISVSVFTHLFPLCLACLYQGEPERESAEHC